MSGERMEEFRLKNDDADREFRQGLQDLVRGHIDGCMNALASCSSARTTEDEEDGGAEHLGRRRRRSNHEGDDLAESSAAARRHSRILSRWVARQAEVMITTMERRNRESELMALAGLHTVSMLDSSFLRESGRAHSSIQPPVAARASSILQRWRELEVEAAAARDRWSTRRGRTSSGSVNATESQASESDDNESGHWARDTFAQVNRRQEELEVEREDDHRSSREQSPDLGDVERERVRQIARGWMTENGIADDASRLSPRNESLRAEWLCETERDRVRLVREWVQMTSQQRDSQARGWERDESMTDHEESQPEQIHRDFLRIRGRQARVDLIMRIVRERQRELQDLSEHRAVSDFAHRSRIQSLLRGRFLRHGRPVEDHRLSSVAARELGQLRQRQPVSELREEFHSRLENLHGQAVIQAETSINGSVSRIGQSNDERPPNAVVELASVNEGHPAIENHEIHQMTETRPTTEVESISSMNDMDMQQIIYGGDNLEEQDAQHGAEERQQSAEVGFSEGRDGTGEESDGIWHEQMDLEWSGGTPEDEDREEHVLGEHEWHADDSLANLENWEGGPSVPPSDQWSIPSRGVNRFISPVDDNLYSMELRELLSRRSVSTLLRSGFRESLSQLIQSYVQRQGLAPLDWDPQRYLSSSALPERDQEQQREDPNQESHGSIARPALLLRSPPVLPRQPPWGSEVHRNYWTRHNMRHSEIEWNITNDLTADIARIKQGMTHIQRMLEGCMDMQLELQRSVRQEVSAALNRYSRGQGSSEEPSDDNSKFGHVRKGTCCICCDNHIDALLYRCGHMCVCSKCANELVQGGGKCPLCRAPIIEVIRAYSIL